MSASNGQAEAEFGTAVAIHGDVAVVGATLQDCKAGADCGGAYVYRLIGSTWIEEAALTAPIQDAVDHFGVAVAVYEDVVVVGATKDDDAASDAGATHVFRFVGGVWVHEQTLTASDALSFDWFGSSVDIDGDVMVVGARRRNNNTGTAYVFRYEAGLWVQEQELVASDAGEHHQFGSSASVLGDRIIVGAQTDDHQGALTGSAYVYRYDGQAWTQEAKLVASDAGAGDWFGISVAIEGPWAVVGARYDDDRGSNAGAVYIFRYNGVSWTQDVKLTASDARSVDRFGESVSISGDVIVAGAPGDDDGGSGAGSAYVLGFDGAQWVELGRLNAADAIADDRLGIAVSISGSVVISGAFRDDDRGDRSGSAYFFRVPDPSAMLSQYAAFQVCFSGSAVGVSLCCEGFDTEPDNDVDLDDYRVLIQNLTNP